MGHHFTGWVIAPIFAAQKNAGYFQRGDVGGQLRWYLSLQVDEAAFFVFKAIIQLGLLHTQNFCQLGELARRDAHIRRACPYGFHGCANGDGIAMPVVNNTAIGRQFDFAAVTGFTLLLQEVMAHALQISGSAGQRDE